MGLSLHPVMLAARFVLELLALGAMGRFGWQLTSGPARYASAFGLPLVAAILWGTFAVPHDPSRSGSAPIAVPGMLRLAIELSFFGFATWTLFRSGARTAGLVFGSSVALLYALSLDRIRWLLGH